jgi:hypothetical protein
MIALGGKVFQIDFQHMLRTGIDTQLAAFAVQIVDLDPSLDGHFDTSFYPDR